MTLSCPLLFFTQEPCPRRGEPVTVGLPWPRGAVTDESLFRLVSPAGVPETLQTRVLDRWPDGSVRWCLFDFVATWDGKTAAAGYRVEVGEHPREDAAFGDTRHAQPLFDLVVDESEQAVKAGETVETGPLRRRRLLNLEAVAGCDLAGFIDEFPNVATLRVQLTIRNPNRADHPGGNWDLGNGGSIYIRDLIVRLSAQSNQWMMSLDRGEQFRRQKSATITQMSSGGENWRSSNHVTDMQEVELAGRGYRCSTDSGVTDNDRATPIVVSDAGGFAMPHFWQNFPKRIGFSEQGVFLELFTADQGTHELQGGEQKTYTFSIAFGRDTVTDEPMIWCRSPTVVTADPDWYAASGAIPYLTPRAADPHAKYLALVDQALDGPDTFQHKREKIDEYGWRNFGDLYADHEAVFHKGPTPLISHYNNQYDCVAAFLLQFFRSGDLRWLTQGLECADHTCDIDVYHTDADKAAYNRGLFWHTYHYADADTGTHRAYPKALTRGPVESLTQKMDELGETAAQLKKSYAVGGGPSASHNYNAGLMLAYFLTGNPLYRDTAVDLAGFVINMEDPARTPFRYLSREYTGLATESGGGGYHGPGRAAGNSILALLVGHQLTGEAKYLTKAEQLIVRVVHPKQNLERLDLLNAELRWFYTMTLQSLGRYLDYKIDLGQLDRIYGYARLTLLHFARWMAANERPILDTPERLQYPTETWAAQDMRKVEVFQFAAKHSTGVEKAMFLERAEWFFDYVQNKLGEFPTKSLTRPVILMMKYGWSRNWWQLHPTATAPEPAVRVTGDDFGDWRMFVPQKTKAIKRAKRIVVFGGVISAAGLAALVWWLFH